MDDTDHQVQDKPHQAELIEGGFSFLVTHKQLGEVLDLGHSMIAKLRDEGMPQVRYGVYDLRACVPWYVDKWRRARGDGSSDETSTRSALNNAQRERIELEIARTRGELVERDTVRATFAALGVILSAAATGFGKRNAPLLAPMSDADAVRLFLDQEWRALLTQMATQVGELAGDLRAEFEAKAAGTDQVRARAAASKGKRKPTRTRRTAAGA